MNNFLHDLTQVQVALGRLLLARGRHRQLEASKLESGALVGPHRAWQVRGGGGGRGLPVWGGGKGERIFFGGDGKDCVVRVREQIQHFSRDVESGWAFLAPGLCWECVQALGRSG